MWHSLMSKVMFVIKGIGTMAVRLLFPLLREVPGPPRAHLPDQAMASSSRSFNPMARSPTSETGRSWEVMSNGTIASRATTSNQEGITPEILRMMGPPPLCQHQEEALLFISKTEQNYQKIFWRCPRPRGRQCQFFMWTEQQPLVEQEYKEFQHHRAQQRARLESSPSSSPKMTLKEKYQSQCHHLATTRQGTNPWKIVEKCLNCDKVLVNERTEAGKKLDKEKEIKKKEKSIYHSRKNPSSSQGNLTTAQARQLIQMGALETGGVWLPYDPSESQ
jgi:hypothetical protein